MTAEWPQLSVRVGPIHTGRMRFQARSVYIVAFVIYFIGGIIIGVEIRHGTQNKDHEDVTRCHRPAEWVTGLTTGNRATPIVVILVPFGRPDGKPDIQPRSPDLRFRHEGLDHPVNAETR